MADNKVAVEISLEEKAALKALTQLTREVNKTETSFKKMGDQGDASLSILEDATKGISNGFGSLVKGVTVANLASSAIIGVANELKEFVSGSIEAAIKQENALNKLGAALKRTGEFSKSAMSDFEEFASGIQQNSTFGDEVILEQLAIAKSYGLTNDKAKQLVSAATELSATFKMDLNSAVKNLGKSYSGMTGELGEALPIIKTLTAEQLRAGGAIELVNKQFAGSAKSDLDVYEGSVKSLSNSYGDLQEQLGFFVTKSDASQSFVSSLSLMFQDATQALADYRIELARGENGFRENGESLNQLTREYESITLQIEALEKKKTLLPGGLDNFDASKLKKYREELVLLEEQVNNAAVEAKVVSTQEDLKNGKRVDNKTISPEDQKRLDSYKQTEIAIRQLKEQSLIADQEQQALLDAQSAEKNELEIQQIYEFEALKLEAQLASEEEKAMLIKESKERSLKLQEIAAKREVEFTKLSNRQIVDEMKKRQAEEEKVQQANLTAAQGFLNAGVALAKQGSKEQKALSYTDAVVNTYAAGLRAYKDYPYPANIGVMASTIAAGMVQVRNISRYEHGGVNGITSGLPTGDNNLILTNGREMILNMGQQTTLFNAIKNGEIGNSSSDEKIDRLIDAVLSQPINLVVDGRVLATVIRREIQGGFRLT